MCIYVMLKFKSVKASGKKKNDKTKKNVQLKVAQAAISLLRH
jgi:hypothetical protein